MTVTLKLSQKRRFMLSMAVSAALSVLVFWIVLVSHRSLLLDAGLWIGASIGGIAAAAGLINVFGSDRTQKYLYGLLAPWGVLSIVFILFGWKYDVIERELADTKLTLSAYRDALRQDLKMPFKGGAPQQLYQFLLGPAKAREVGLLAINATGLLHDYRRKLERMIGEGGHVRILLLDPDSEAWELREKYENSRKSKRLRVEWNASMAILSDIVNHLLENDRYTLRELQERLQIRLHDQKPERFILFVERDEQITKDGKSISVDRKYLLLNRYPKCPKILAGGADDTAFNKAETVDKCEYGQASLSLLVDPSWTEYHENMAYFNLLWDSAKGDEYPLARGIGVD